MGKKLLRMNRGCPISGSRKDGRIVVLSWKCVGLVHGGDKGRFSALSGQRSVFALEIFGRSRMVRKCGRIDWWRMCRTPSSCEVVSRPNLLCCVDRVEVGHRGLGGIIISIVGKIGCRRTVGDG